MESAASFLLYECSRGQVGVTQNICPVHNQAGKSIQHMFFDSDAANRRWAVVEAIVRHSPLQSLVHEDFFLTLQKAFQRQRSYPSDKKFTHHLGKEESGGKARESL